MAAPTVRLATIAAVEVTGWRVVRGEGGLSSERCVVRATLTDGRVVEREALVEYKRGEREKLMDAVIRDDPTWVDRIQRRVLFRRSRAIEAARGELQREYGGGVPWEAPAAETAA